MNVMHKGWLTGLKYNFIIFSSLPPIFCCFVLVCSGSADLFSDAVAFPLSSLRCSVVDGCLRLSCHIWPSDPSLNLGKSWWGPGEATLSLGRSFWWPVNEDASGGGLLGGAAVLVVGGMEVVVANLVHQWVGSLPRLVLEGMLQLSTI